MSDLRTPSEREADRARAEAEAARSVARDAVVNEAVATDVAAGMATQAAREHNRADFYAGESFRQEVKAETLAAQRDQAAYIADRAETGERRASTAVWFLVAALVIGTIFAYNALRGRDRELAAATAPSNTTVIRREVERVAVPVPSTPIPAPPAPAPVIVDRVVERPVVVQRPVVVPVPVQPAAPAAPAASSEPAAEPAPATQQPASGGGQPLQGYVEPAPASGDGG